MAYRFLLEVPDALYAQANVVINHAPDAEIVDVHEGIGGDFDIPGKTMTLAGHSLDLVHRIHDWYADVLFHMPDAPPVNFLLVSGGRLGVALTHPDDVVAAVRRDQPWVERTIPKIGEHAVRTAPPGVLKPAVATMEARLVGTDSSRGPRLGNITILATDEPRDHPVMVIDDVPMLHLPVIDLGPAERTYAEIFGAALMDRADRDGRGGYIWHGADFEIEQEAHEFGVEPDFAFLQNGPLAIALERIGRAYPLDVFSNPPAPIRLLVDDASFANIRGEVLIRNWNVFDDSTGGVFGFRDPFGYTWAIHSESFDKGSSTNA
jgi:hypothetical protein